MEGVGITTSLSLRTVVEHGTNRAIRSGISGQYALPLIFTRSFGIQKRFSAFSLIPINH